MPELHQSRQPVWSRQPLHGSRLAHVLQTAVLGFCLLFGLSCGAQEPEAQWRTVAGFPTKAATALVQTRDGYLWVGTYEGLIRYDGITHTLFADPMVPTSHDVTVTALYEAPDGTLWIGHEHGAVSAYRDGVFTEYPARSEWKADRYHAITSDASGNIWLLDRRGELARLRDGLVLQPEWGGRNNTWGLVRSHDARLWVVNGGRLSELIGTTLRVVEPPPGCTDAIQAVVARPAGGIWVVAGGRLWQQTETGWLVDSEVLDIGERPISVALATTDGRIFLGTFDHGVLELRPGESRPARASTRETGLPSNWVLAACEDHEGGVWLGTGSAGVLRLEQRKVQLLQPADAWRGQPVLNLCAARDGGFLVGTEGAGLYRMARDGAWAVLGAETGLRNNYVWAMHEDSTGAVWAGTWRGLDVMTGDRFAPAPGTADFVEPITALMPSRDGGLWVGSRNGLARYTEGRLHWIEPTESRRLREIRNILEEPDGSLWVSTGGYGLGRVEHGQVRQFTRRDGLGSDFTHGLLLDEDGVLWIGTRGGGINRLKLGRFSSVRTEHGLGSNSISQIEDDGLGFLWMSSPDGIFRVSKAELNACADGSLGHVRCFAYGPGDGLPEIACSSSQPAPGIRAPDGRMVFTTNAGLALIDPRAAVPNPRPPPVVIEGLHNGDRWEREGPFPAEIDLGPGARRIEIRYTGLSFAQPDKVRFRCLLEGFDPGWVDMGGQRRALYSYLPPGRYVFRVTAANNDGVWNEEGRSMVLLVPPYLWQTLWFRLVIGTLGALLAGSLIWFQARRRLLRRLEVLERERAIEAERTRIANDMHDDIGAGLTRINLLAATPPAELHDPDRAERLLAQIHETSRSVTRAIDEIVWAVNPRHDTLESLVNYLERLALDLVHAAQMQCRLDMPVDIPPWRPGSEVRHQLCLAYKEALNNAVRHSGGRRITVSLTIYPECIHLVVADDGRGPFPASAEPGRIASGNGLPGMRRRLARIGGTCEFRAGAAGGTEVVFRVPAAALGWRK